MAILSEAGTTRRGFLNDLATAIGLIALSPTEIVFADEMKQSETRCLMSNRIVTELRTALTVQNFSRAVAFYHDALGLPVVESWNHPEGSGMILDAGRATLELLSGDMATYIDQVEAKRRVAGPVRFALQVDDSRTIAKKLVKAGATQLADIVVTPWNDRNVRIQAPDGMQITLFTVLK